MKKDPFRNKIPPLSSLLNQSQNESFIIRKRNDDKINKYSEFTKNSSIDYEDLRHNHRFNLIRKISKSSHMAQKYGNFSRFMSNIRSSENIYKDMNFINAPSFNKNLSSIHQMIKGKRYQNIKLLDSMFFNSGFSNDYLDDFNKIKTNDFSVMNKKNKLRPLQRNNSCEELIDVSKKLKNIIKSEETQQLSTNFSKAINIKKNNSNIFNNKLTHKNKNSSSNYSTTSNKSMITSKFPEFQSYSNSNECINEESANDVKNEIVLPKLPISKNNKSIIPQINSQDSSIFESERYENDSPKRESTFITHLNTTKMRYKINNLLIENIRGKEKIDSFEEKILKLKIFQTYQKEGLEKLLNDERFSVQERIDHIIKMYNIYENIYADYSRDLNRYNNFLFRYSNEIEIDLRICAKQKKDLLYEIEVLVDKLVRKQKDFEYLINTRNFIFWVKNIGKNIITMDNQYVYRISKRRKFAEALLDILGKKEDSFAFKYLKKIIPLDQLESIVAKMTKKMKPQNRRRSILRKSSSISNSTERTMEKINEQIIPPPPGEIIFETPDDFLKVMNNLKYDEINLLKEYEKVQLEKGKLLKELNNELNIFEKYENSFFTTYIKIGEKELGLEKKQNLKLSEKCEHIKDILDNKKDLSSLKQDFRIVSFNSFNNIYYYNLIKYNKLRIKSKFEGWVLLEKLIGIIQFILSTNEKLNLFDLEEVYLYVSYDMLKQILLIKKDYFNDNNQYLIREYTLNLIKLYEYFCQLIINKNEESKNIYKDKYIKFKEEVQIERKKSNTKIIKKMIKNRREADTKKLIEKWNKKTVYETRKKDLDEKPNVRKNMSVEYIKEKENLGKIDKKYEEYNILVEDD